MHRTCLHVRPNVIRPSSHLGALLNNAKAPCVHIRGIVSQRERVGNSSSAQSTKQPHEETTKTPTRNPGTRVLDLQTKRSEPDIAGNSNTSGKPDLSHILRPSKFVGLGADGGILDIPDSLRNDPRYSKFIDTVINTPLEDYRGGPYKLNSYRGIPELEFLSDLPHLNPYLIDRCLYSWLRLLRQSLGEADYQTYPPLRISENIRIHVLTPIAKSKTCVEVEFSNDKGNSLNRRLLADLTKVFRALAKNIVVKGVTLRGVSPPGKKNVFSAGADVREMANLEDPPAAAQFIGNISALCSAIRDLPVPVVAAIDGPCIGAGLEVAASCDLRVATTRSTFSMPEVHLAIPSVVEARLLCDIVGWGRARHLMYTGCVWDLQEAYQAGLVTKTFQTQDDMSAWTRELGEQILAGHGVYKAQKGLFREWEAMSVEEGIKAGQRCFALRFRPNTKVGVEATMKQHLAAMKEAKEVKMNTQEAGTSVS